MENNKIIAITCTQTETLEDLKDFLSGEFQVEYLSLENGENVALGNGIFGISVVIEYVKSNAQRFVAVFKNWVANYNKDVELTFENGDKKATFKCPANRVTDEQIDAFFSILSNFYD